MDDRQFDSLVKSFDGTRRGILRVVGAGALTAIAARFALAERAEAKKKHGKKKKKKCKAGTRACNGGCIPQSDCCIDADCGQNQTCTGGQCVAINAPQCQNDGDCSAGQVCQNGQCVAVTIPECQVDQDCRAGFVCQNGHCVAVGECQNNNDCASNEICLLQKCQCKFPSKPCGNVCCASDEACVNGTCVVGQGTCAAGQDICAGDDVTCNGNPNCTCGIRLDDGEPRCVQFVNDSRTICTCNNDFRCEQDFGAGTICIKGGSSCPDCTLATLGRCARLCPGSN